MSSVRSDTFVVVPSVSRLTPEQKKESLFEAAKTGKKTFILKYFYCWVSLSQILYRCHKNISQVRSGPRKLLVMSMSLYITQIAGLQRGRALGYWISGLKGREEELAINIWEYRTNAFFHFPVHCTPQSWWVTVWPKPWYLCMYLILFQTKISDFPHPISNLSNKLIPHFRPKVSIQL